MNEAPLLRVDKLEVVYHRTITAVQGISLAAEAGQIVAVLGTNGAGKSTTLRAISGFLGIDDARVTDGSVTFKARRIENRPPNEIARLGVVLVPERDKVFANLTVAENLAAPFAPSARVVTQACPLFVPLVEEGWWSGDVVAAQRLQRAAISKGLVGLGAHDAAPSSLIASRTRDPIGLTRR